MIEFLKSVFKSNKVDPVVKTYDVGKTVATIHLREPSGGSVDYKLHWIGIVLDNGDTYANDIVDSNTIFNNWLTSLGRFVWVSQGIYVPIEDIQSITSERSSYIVEAGQS